LTILDEILEHKRGEVEAAKARLSAGELRAAANAVTEPPRGFSAALRAGPAPSIIAELKRRSPSKGLIREDFEPVSLARAYEQGGAGALSVLTDEHFFGGSLAYLSAVREAVSLPLLRKDFVVDAYQIDEARVAGADAVLLIVAALPPDQLTELHVRATELGLDVLVEVHDAPELEVALTAGASLIGVNNRDLKTFEVNLATFEAVVGHLAGDPNIIRVAESGIHGPEDVSRLEKAGGQAFFVGESLMREANVAEALNELRRRK